MLDDVTSRISKLWRAVAALFLLAVLSACAMPQGGAIGFGSEPVKVALLVPRSDTNSMVRGQIAPALENGARLALNDLGTANIELRVYDSGGNEAIAAQAAARAVAEGASMIVGPLYASSAAAVARTVAPANINVLSFSNNPAVAGGNLFILGTTFDSRADRLVSFAAGQGLRNVGIVSPQNEAGAAARAAIAGATSRIGSSVVANETFPFSPEGLQTSAPRMAAGLRANGANFVILTVDIDNGLPYLSPALVDGGLDPRMVQMAGLPEWTDPALFNVPGINGGWFTMNDRSRTAAFEQRYRAAFGTAPHALASAAYDGIAAVGALLQSRRSNPFSRGAITAREGFSGAGGIFRFRDDGTNQRALAVMQVSSGTVRQVDPAPTSFNAPGF